MYSFVTNNTKNKPFPEIKFKEANIDYVMFTDDVKENETVRDGWTLFKIPSRTQELPHFEDMNKYVKWHVHKYFGDKYDYAIYIDSKFEIHESPRKIVDALRLKMPLGIAMHTYDWIGTPGHYDNMNSVQKHIRYLVDCKAGMGGNLLKYSKYLIANGYRKSEPFAESGVQIIDINNPMSKFIQESVFDEYMKSGTLRD